MTISATTVGGSIRLLICVGLVASAGLASCKSDPGGCADNGDCAAGSVCAAGACRTLCRDDIDCDEPCSAGQSDGQICSDGICVGGCRDTRSLECG